MEIKIKADDHLQGAKNAAIQLIEYGDYECPYCKKASYIIKEAQEELGDNLMFVFRNFPLTDIHPYALKAAAIAETAALQDKFGEMHDILFENQEELADPYLLNYARQIGLNMDQLEKDFTDQKYAAKIREDYESGTRYAVDGTPALFINGNKFDGNWMGEEFIEYMRSLI
ncbi:MAG: DsbA family protein [Tannerellaceae bacterium]|nr:DsbA family protein [Tannerellaceae bacterium]